MTVRNILIFLILAALVLTGCVPAGEAPREETQVPVIIATEPATEPPATEPPATEPVETLPPETEPPTHPLHSELYIEGLDVADVILYFNEVCLDAEVVHGGDASLLQKWAEPIRYTLFGEYTQEDLETLTAFCDWLNTVEGFPGIGEAEDSLQANLRIHFCTQEEMPALMGEWAVGLDGAVTFWYLDDEIYDATICIRSDIPQDLRNSIILEELYNGLGPVQDTALRPDSIIFAEYSQPQELTAVDRLLLQLLYHPGLVCGMDAAACEEAIRNLYY